LKKALHGLYLPFISVFGFEFGDQLQNGSEATDSTHPTPNAT